MGGGGGAYIRRGLSSEGNLHFIIDWASRIVGSKFTVFALFYFVFEGNFPTTSPRGAYIWRGDLAGGGGVALPDWRRGGLYAGGAYFRNFTVCVTRYPSCAVQYRISSNMRVSECALTSNFRFSFGESRLRDSITASNKLHLYRHDRIAGGPQG